MDDFEREIKMDFLIETKDLLSETEQCFLNLEKKLEDHENLILLFRLAHNLKGSAGAVGFMELADFTHKLESLLLAVKDRTLRSYGAVTDLLLRSNDYLKHVVEILLQNIEADYANPALAAEIVQCIEQSGEISSEPAGVVNGDTPEQEISLSVTPAASGPTQKSKDESIRVSLSRIEKLLNNVGELSILQAVMVQQTLNNPSATTSLVRETLSSMSKIIKETQSLSMGLRMLPIRQTFHKMERIVRDTSKALNKEVQLHMSGEETEIDKTVIEQIADPLVHIIRNAVDHGLECTEERGCIGKPKVGNIYLSSYYKSGRVVIEVRDDGKGLDAEKLIRKAKEKGLIEHGQELTNEQAYQLIFAPGFSTKEQITDVSGRGVGMDVVKTNIQAIKGNVEIYTGLGQGTCFRIYLPLTLAIIDGVVVRMGTERFVIPLSQVSEFYRPEEKDINCAFEKSDLLKLRNETLPVLRLSTLLAKDKNSKESAWDLYALIVRDAGTDACAIMVDQVVAQQQVVIKPLGAEMKDKRGIMGSAILGDGRPSLILDLYDLIQSQNSNENKTRQIKMEAA